MAGNETLDIYQELLNRNAVPNEHRDTVDELVRRGVLKGASGPGKQDVGPVEATLRQGLDAATFGYNDKAAAAIKSTFGGGSYDTALARERARTQASGQQTLPWLIGQTAGNVAQGLATLPVAPAVGSYQFAKEAARPVGSALMEFSRGIPDAIRYGVAYGAADAAGHADGSLGNQLGSIAEGGATGAVLGPAMYGGIYGAGKLFGAAQRRQEATRNANAARADELRAVGVTDPLPALVSDSKLLDLGTRMSGAGIGGGAVTAKAADNTAQFQGSLNRLMSGRVDGQEAGDLGRTVQGDLRRALVDRSKSSDELAGMPKPGLERMTGSVTPEGFRPSRANIDPVRPRDVESVQPQDVGTRPVRPPASGTADEISSALAVKDREIAAAVAQHNVARETAIRLENEANQGLQDAGIARLSQQGDGHSFIVDFPGNPGEVPRRAIVDLSQPAGALAQQLTSQQYIAAHRFKMMADANARSTESSRQTVDRLRQMYAERDAIERDLSAHRGQAASENIAHQQALREHEARRTSAQAEAAAETARRQEQARREAQDATSEAQRIADERYQREVASGKGFDVGRSRESYPTELSAGYELAKRETPPVRVNPLGDKYSGTATTKVLEDIAKEGSQSLQLRGYGGRVIGDDGHIDPQLAGFLRSKIGGDMVGRLEALSELRARGGAAQPGVDGIKALLSDIRGAARAAEKPPYPGVPRTDEAAMLRRLATAVQEDMYGVIGKAGQPASFNTASTKYKVTPSGHTQSDSRAPSDATYYVSEKNLARMTRGEAKPDMQASWPATLSLKAEGNTIGRYDNQRGVFDRSSLIPFETKPQPGLVPVEVWGDGARVRYGAPITSRETTTGERAVGMWRDVDAAYSKYVNEMRRPLSKIFGPNVEGVQALDRLVSATKKGETGILSPYMRVMTEKSDPTRGTASVVYHMTDGGRDVKQFIKAWGEIPPISKRVLFDTGPEGRALERELNRYVEAGKKLEKYNAAAKVSGVVDPARLTHLATVAGVWVSMPTVVGAIAGNAVAARVLASPRLLRWMTTFPEAARGGFQTETFSRHLARLGAIASTDEKDSASKALYRAVMTTTKKVAGEMIGGEAQALTMSDKYAPVDKSRTDEAGRIYDSGGSHDDAWKKTGTARLGDGSNLHEVDDSGASLVVGEGTAINKVRGHGSDWKGSLKTTLKDVLKHDEFYKNSPKIVDYTRRNSAVESAQQMPVTFVPRLLNPGADAEYRIGKGIFIKNSFVHSPTDSIRNIILHEVQHAIDLSDEMRAARATQESASASLGAVNSELKTAPLSPREKRVHKEWNDYASSPLESNAFNAMTRSRMSGDERKALPPWETVGRHLARGATNKLMGN